MRNTEKGPWTLPEPWTHRTRPPLLGKPHRTRFPTAPTALIVINQEGSLLVSDGGQKILSLDINEFVECGSADTQMFGAIRWG
jgi:hypothetical protein